MISSEECHSLLAVKDSTILILEKHIEANNDIIHIKSMQLVDARKEIEVQKKEMKKQNRKILIYRVGISALAIITVTLMLI
jgi:hypothetical protein